VARKEPTKAPPTAAATPAKNATINENASSKNFHWLGSPALAMTEVRSYQNRY
jgi:hypothetical protein